MEPLSKPLADWLIELNLCSRADFRRCRGRVRQLARDLPAFDSVWIDALVHARKLTAFQARLLESGKPEQLAIGPLVVVDQLGHGMSRTFLARPRHGRDQCVVKRISRPVERRGPALSSLQLLVSRAEQLTHPGVICPVSCLGHEEDLVTVSRYLAGPTLSQLLVRRGRFPVPVVVALARQLIDSLAALEAVGLVHGDVRLENLRLSASGRVVMVDAGIAPAIQPELDIHARIPAEHYDGIAPELISTGHTADVRSEFYALGCLLWQLLAGRAPYPTGDPLAKLMSHQTKRIPDIREIAPDTPDDLAGILRVLTDPDPLRRPPSFQAFREKWGGAKHSHRRTVARFRALFNTAIPHIPSLTPNLQSNPWPMTAAVMFLLSGVSLSLMDAGSYTKLLAIPQRIASQFEEPKPPETTATTVESSPPNFAPLPTPGPNGVIELPADKTYAATSLERVGNLTIRGVKDSPAKIALEDQPFRIRAMNVTFENVIFVSEGTAKNTGLEVESRTVKLSNCRWEPGSEINPFAPKSSAIAWKHIDRAQPTNGGVALQNCILPKSQIGVRCASPPRQLQIVNVLHVGGDVLAEIATDSPAHPAVEIKLSHVTLRNSNGFLRTIAKEKPTSISWVIDAEQCVFSLHETDAALFSAISQSPAELLSRVQFQGRQCLLNPGATVANWRSPQSSELTAWDSSNMAIEGLLLAKLQFAGAQPTAKDAVLQSWQGPRFSSIVPGIQLDGLLPATEPEASLERTAARD